MEEYLNSGIKTVIEKFPQVGGVLDEYGIGCGPCSVGTCLLKDIVKIHSLPRENGNPGYSIRFKVPGCRIESGMTENKQALRLIRGYFRIKHSCPCGASRIMKKDLRGRGAKDR